MHLDDRHKGKDKNHAELVSCGQIRIGKHDTKSDKQAEVYE
jgi:hypothetical protein